MISAALNRSNQANTANLETSLQEKAPPLLKAEGRLIVILLQQLPGSGLSDPTSCCRKYAG